MFYDCVPKAEFAKLLLQAVLGIALSGAVFTVAQDAIRSREAIKVERLADKYAGALQRKLAEKAFLVEHLALAHGGERAGHRMAIAHRIDHSDTVASALIGPRDEGAGRLVRIVHPAGAEPHQPAISQLAADLTPLLMQSCQIDGLVAGAPAMLNEKRVVSLVRAIPASDSQSQLERIVWCHHAAGFAFLTFSVESFFKDLLIDHPGAVLVTLFDQTLPDPDELIFERSPEIESQDESQTGSDEATNRAISIGDRNWTLSLTPLPQSPFASREITAWMALAGGIMLTLLSVIQSWRQNRIRKALLEATAQARNADLAKTRFMAAASHDLRQPFQAMTLFYHLLKDSVVAPDDKKLLNRLGDAIDAGDSLLASLLDVSTLEAGTLSPKIETFCLGDVFAKLHSECASQAEFQGLELRVVTSSLMVRSDRVLVARILRNLLANALRYTKNGRILLGCRIIGGCARIEVWDTGQGIPADRLALIFDDFYQIGNPEQDRSKGLGLGLAIVSRMARLLNLRVTVQSELGKGSVFGLELPIERSQAHSQ